MNLSRLWERWGRHGRLLLVAALTAAAYLAALSRDGVQVWVVAALLLSTLLTGIFWPRWMSRRIRASRRCPDRATEGDTVAFDVELRNGGWLPRYMIDVLDRLPRPDLSGREVGEVPLAQVAFLGPGAVQRIEAAIAFERRGLFEIGPLTVATGFPLGLTDSRVELAGGRQSVLVHPSLFAIAGLALRGTPRLIHRGALMLTQGSGSTEFRGLREYRPRDNPRHIHWPTSARLNRLMVREFEPMAAASLQLVLDLHKESDVGSGRHSTLEYGIRIAGSIARFACERGMPVSLVGTGEVPFDVPALSGDAQLTAILRNLALAQPLGMEPYPDLLQRIAAHVDPGDNMILFCACAARYSDAFLDSISILRQKGAHLTVFVLDRDSFASSRPAADDAIRVRVAALVDMGIEAVAVRRDDDLEALLNP